MSEEKEKEMICIRCPLGCRLTVTISGDGAVAVTGNTCPRGAAYGEKEVTNPTRIVTSTVRIKGSRSVVSVKTASDIPKGRIMDIMKLLADIEVSGPVHIGDVILKDAAGTGVDVVATRNEEGGEE